MSLPSPISDWTAKRVPTTVEKECRRCGAPFNCKQEAGCWCAAMRIDPVVLAELRTRFSDCLCEACLRKLAAPRSEPVRWGLAFHKLRPDRPAFELCSAGRSLRSPAAFSVQRQLTTPAKEICHPEVASHKRACQPQTQRGTAFRRSPCSSCLRSVVGACFERAQVGRRPHAALDVLELHNR